jgi:NAD(P)-dependent dehydrogenase (short-subunit alcohol dehydrogenase family)
MPALERATSARVVNVSSRLHLPDSRGPGVAFDFGDAQLERGYQPDRAYKNSKLAVMWFTYELARRLPPRTITANAVCPGFVPTTAAESAHGVKRLFMRTLLPHMSFATSIAAASDSLVFMATDPTLDGVTGRFFGEMHPIQSSQESHDADKARRFWALAAGLTGFHALD